MKRRSVNRVRVALAHDDGLTDAEIADTTGMGRDVVGALRRDLGLRPNSRFDRDRAAELLRKGGNVIEVAASLGVSPSAIYMAAKRHVGLAQAMVETHDARMSKRARAVKVGSQARAARIRTARGGTQKPSVEQVCAPEPAEPVRVRATPPAETMARIKADGLGAPKPSCAPVPAGPWTPEQDEALAATGGRYARLAHLAWAWGMEIKRVQARYHRVAT